MWTPSANHPVRRLFAGLTEHAFVSTLGIADPPLVDYVSDMLTRFLHMDSLHRLRNFEGRPLSEVADMVMEAESLPTEGRTRREYHRHIGDFTLFWTGLYPDAVQRMRRILGARTRSSVIVPTASALITSPVHLKKNPTRKNREFCDD